MWSTWANTEGPSLVSEVQTSEERSVVAEIDQKVLQLGCEFQNTLNLMHFFLQNCDCLDFDKEHILTQSHSVQAF